MKKNHPSSSVPASRCTSPTACHSLVLHACLLSLLMVIAACSHQQQEPTESLLLFEDGSYPHACYYKGTYYFTHQSPRDDIRLSSTPDLTHLPDVAETVVFSGDSMGLYHIWAPEIYRLHDRWYIYFEADDNNTDNHQLYVIQCAGDDPLHDPWTLCGTLRTNDEWNYGIHPNVLEVNGQLYLLWSGWPKRRVEHETQCIYIASLSDPCTVSSERVLLSRPDYEWERQWINPDGSRSAYPIYVNENPQAYLSPDGHKVCVCYSASGIWTRFHVMGMLTASANADLLDPSSWTKSPEPILVDDNLYGASNICIIPSSSPDSAVLLFDALWDDEHHQMQRSIFLKTIRWSQQGTPAFKE